MQLPVKASLPPALALPPKHSLEGSRFDANMKTSLQQRGQISLPLPPSSLQAPLSPHPAHQQALPFVPPVVSRSELIYIHLPHCFPADILWGQ